MGIKYTDEFLISELKRFCNENGRVPTYNDFKNNKNFPNISTYRRRFGTWNKALEKGGFSPCQKYTDRKLLNEIQRFYKEYDRIPTANDFQINKKFPGVSTYQNHFGSWNDALKLAGLPVNQISKLTGAEQCYICKTYKTSQWYYKDNKRICQKCHDCDRNYLYGTLDPNSHTGIGVITEETVYQILNDCEKCNTADNFNSDYDLISNKYKNVNVKSSKLYKNVNDNSYKWNFCKRKNSKIPNNYVCIGFNNNRTQILKVWIIPTNSKLITNRGINITHSEIGLKRAQQYEVDPTPYNEVYQNLDITTLPEFRNINNNFSQTEAI